MLADRQGYKVTETQVEQQKGDFRQSRYFNEYLHGQNSKKVSRNENDKKKYQKTLKFFDIYI